MGKMLSSQAKESQSLPDGIIATIASYAAYSSHPTDLDTIRDASPSIRKAVDRHPSLFNNATLLEIRGAPIAEMNGIFEADATTQECVGTPPCVYAFSSETKNIFVRKIGPPWTILMQTNQVTQDDPFVIAYSAYGTENERMENGAWVSFLYLWDSRIDSTKHPFRVRMLWKDNCGTSERKSSSGED